MHSIPSKYKPLVYAGIFLSLCQLIALMVAWQTQRNNEQAVLRALQVTAETMADHLTEKIAVYEHGLLGIKGLVVSAGENLRREHFVRYLASQDLDKMFPGSRGFGFIRIVSPEDEAEFLARIRATEFPEFSIQQQLPNEGDRYIIQYFEPLENARRALGLDIAAENRRNLVARQSMRTGQITMSAPIASPLDAEEPLRFVHLTLPIFKQGAQPINQQQREEQAYGWAFAPLMLQKLIEYRQEKGQDLLLTISDVTDGSELEVFAHDKPAGLKLVHAQPVVRELFGRSWRFEVSATPGYALAQGLPDTRLVFASGSLLAILGSLVVLAMASSLRFKREGSYQRELMATVVENSPDAIITCDVDGLATGWNPAAEMLFGFSREEAIGNRVSTMIVPEGLASEQNMLAEKMGSLQSVPYLVTRRHKKSGQEVDVSMAFAPIIDGGKAIGASMIMRDITEAMATQRQVVELNKNLEYLVERRTQELSDSQDTLLNILDCLPFYLAYWDTDMRCIMLNRRNLERLNITQEDARGRHYIDLVGEEGYALAGSNIEKTLRTGKASNEEYVMKDPNGVEHHMLSHVVPELVDGEVKGFITLWDNITEMRANEAEVAALTRENQALFTTIDQQFLYSVTDPNGSIIEVNDRFCELVGYGRNELLGKNHRLFKSGEHDAGFWAQMWETIKSGETWSGEVCNITRQGERRWLDTVISPYLGTDGNVERFVAMRTDITAKHAAEKERNQVSQLLQSVLDASTAVAFVSTDRQGTITMFNSGAENMLGYAADELIGKQTPAVFHDMEEVRARGDALSAQFNQTIEGFDVFVFLPRLQGVEIREWTYIRKNGLRLRVSLAVTAMRDERNDIAGYLGVALDITKQAEARREMYKAMELADKSNKAKSQFLANMSHEIRTPMNAVLGMLQLVRRTELSEKQQEYISKADIAAKSLLGLLNDILDVSKIEADKLELDYHAVELNELLAELAVVLEGYHQEQDVSLLFDIDPTLPRQIEADQLRLQQVLINLGGNALKFTQQGHVMIQLKKLCGEGDRVTLRVAVVDTGIGISGEQINRIFEGFTQAEASTTRRFGGTGLGLLICKRLIEKMGGDLRVESQQGRGSRFWFDLDLKVIDEQPLVSAARSAHILVAEADERAQVMHTGLLVQLGYTVDYAADYAGLSNKLRASSGKAFELLLIDRALPGLKLTELAQQLNGYDASQTIPKCVIMTTTHQRLLDDRQLESFTCKPVLIGKPFTTQQLEQAIGQAFSEKSPGLSLVNAPAASEGLRLQGLQLLVVEDNELNRQIAAELLAEEGATVDLAEGGLQGVEKVLHADSAYDLVLMDMQMPDIDGLETARRIRASIAMEELPILAMTANVSPADREACLAAGMNEHVGKPIDIHQLVPVILSLTGRQTEQREEEIVEETAVVISPNVLKRFGGKLTLFQRVQAQFEPEMALCLEQLAAALSADDREQAQAVLHTVKGTAATLGAGQLSDFAAKLELGLKKDQYGPLSSLVPENSVEQLHHLVAMSAVALADFSASGTTTEPGTGAAEMASVDLVSHLKGIQAMLVADNLQALDELEALCKQLSAAQLQQLSALKTAVFDLDFKLANSLMEQLLEVL